MKVVSRELYYWSGQKWKPPEEGMWRLEIRGLRSSHPQNGKNISGRSISTCRTLKVETYSMSSIKWDKALMKYSKWGRDTAGAWWEQRSRSCTSDPKALLTSLDYIPGLVRSLWSSCGEWVGDRQCCFPESFTFALGLKDSLSKGTTHYTHK